MRLTDSALTCLVMTLENAHPNPEGTFAEMLSALRELQRARAVVDACESVAVGFTNVVYREGWQDCIDAVTTEMERDDESH